MSNRASFHNGFAPRDGEPEYPSLWRDLYAAYAPILGTTGARLVDQSPRKRTLDITGATLATAWDIFGSVPALDFDGAAVRATFPSVIYPTWQPMCVTAWVRATSNQSGYIFGQGSSASGNPLLGLNLTGSGQARMTVRDNFGGVNVAGGSTVTDGNWWLLAGETDANGVAYLYENGKLVATDNSPTLGAVTFDTCNIGRLDYLGGLLYFLGQIAEVRLHNRRLSPGEHNLLHRIGPGGSFTLAPQHWAPEVTTNRRRRLLIGSA